MAGYTLSGIVKLYVPAWQEGTAIADALSQPMANEIALTHWVQGLPEGVLQFMTWCILAAELLALPLAIAKPTRKWGWLSLLLSQGVCVLLFGFHDVTPGVLILHLFIFDRSWLKPVAMKSAHPVVFFDGVCNLCNHTVDFIVSEDELRRFRFAPIQGKTAETIDVEEVKSGESMALQMVIFSTQSPTRSCVWLQV